MDMETFKAVLKKKVSWGDLDPLGIVFYPRYYEWIDAASQIKEIQEKTVLLNHEIRLSKKSTILAKAYERKTEDGFKAIPIPDDMRERLKVWQ